MAICSDQNQSRGEGHGFISTSILVRPSILRGTWNDPGPSPSYRGYKPTPAVTYADTKVSRLSVCVRSSERGSVSRSDEILQGRNLVM